MSIFRNLGLGSLLLLLVSCVCRSADYCSFYSYLRNFHPIDCSMQEDPYFLVILVNARHLDYTDAAKFFHSVAKHPSDHSKTGDVGHAWIYLQGWHNGKLCVVEGGHSGERQTPPARYFDGIMNYHEWGMANPSFGSTLTRYYEPNPVKYLWTMREDGFFQRGSGGHHPTFAAKVALTEQQFESILRFIHPTHYPYRFYSLVSSQCTTFITQVAALAGWILDDQLSMTIPPTVDYGGVRIRLWEDPRYSILTLGTPDQVEKSLVRAVQRGEADYALEWYLAHRKAKEVKKI